MKKVYLCEPEKATYGLYDGVVIVADDIREVREILSNGFYGDAFFEEWQGEVTITEVDLSTTESKIVLASNIGGNF